MKMVQSRLRHAVALATMLAVLSACGGGGGSSAPTSSGSSAAVSETSASGTITGFGSVIVEGVKYDDSGASVITELDASSPLAMSSSGLRLGQQVELQLNGTSASSITVISEVLGRITSLRSDGFVVAGQTVKVSLDPAAPTVYEGVAGLSGLAVNDVVEVHGSRNAASEIVATRIERKDGLQVASVRVQGTISALNVSARQFAVAGLLVDYSSALRVRPVGVVLADGQRVSVWSDTPVVGNQLNARSVVVKGARAVSDEKLRVAGLVRDFNAATRSFKLDTFDVDATNAAFERGSFADLANGRRVAVRGTFVNGRLVASEVRFRRDLSDATVELTGAITDFVSIASFKVRGVPIDASDTAIVYSNGNSSNLANGVVVEVKGNSADNVVKPVSIEIKSANPGVRPTGGPSIVIDEVKGIAYDVDITAGRFKVNGTTVQWNGATLFQGSASNLVNGARIEVAGVFANGSFVATRIEIERP